jgi:hypothetical protein
MMVKYVDTYLKRQKKTVMVLEVNKYMAMGLHGADTTSDRAR